MNRCAQCGGKFGLIRHRWYSRQFCSLRCRGRFLINWPKGTKFVTHSTSFKARSATARRVMNVQSRHWLDYDPVALVVLVVGMSAVALLALSI
jgi:endogenous inhibitor of DNA gyrase (YacG/DUF329 family)